MKKILIGLFALASVSAFANEGINVYGKVGLDISSKFSGIKDEDTGTYIIPKKGKTGANFALEITKNITSNLELGAGLAYTYRKDDKVKKEYSINNQYKTKGTEEWTMPRYNSIPLYLIAKYNFDINTYIKPYIKVDLGYSFNNAKNSIDVSWSETDTNGKRNGVEKEKIKIANGLYAAVGVGAEYNNFLADLSYVRTNSKIKDSDGCNDKYNNSSVRLSVGYKFNF